MSGLTSAHCVTAMYRTNENVVVLKNFTPREWIHLVTQMYSPVGTIIYVRVSL